MWCDAAGICWWCSFSIILSYFLCKGHKSISVLYSAIQLGKEISLWGDLYHTKKYFLRKSCWKSGLPTMCWRRQINVIRIILTNGRGDSINTRIADCSDEGEQYQWIQSNTRLTAVYV